MKKLLICMAAATALLTAAPAFAQVGFYADGPGIDVRIGRDYDRGWRGGWHRGRDYRHHYGFYRDRDDCREVTVRQRRWDGSVVVRREFRC